MNFNKEEILKKWNDYDKCPDFRPVLDQLLDYIPRLEKEADIGCQALHSYRDNMAYKCKEENPDSRVVAFGEIYTGRRAHKALTEMPEAVKRRHDRYLKETQENE